MIFDCKIENCPSFNKSGIYKQIIKINIVLSLFEDHHQGL